MNEMVLLGAGASVEAGVPTSYAMGREMYPRFKQLILPGMRNDYARAFAFIVSGLRFEQSTNWGDPYADVDVETLLSAALALSDNARLTSELAPFIQAWHPTIDDINAQHRVSRVPDVFEQVAAHMQQMLADIVWIEDADTVTYLAPLLALLQCQTRLVIATLNYDNTIELLAQSHGIPCDTGIEEWSENKMFGVVGEGMRLLKLHGSVNWELFTEASSAAKPMTLTALNILSNDEMGRRKVARSNPYILTRQEGQYMPGVIFGQRNKLTADGPFLDLLQAFKQELAASDRLTAIGYSFRDAHINTCIAHWLHNGADRHLRIITRNFDGNHTDFANELRNAGERYVEIINATASVGLQQVYGVYHDAHTNR